MDNGNNAKRWPVAVIIIAAVVIAAAALIYAYRDAPGSLPAQAISDDAGGVIVAWRDESGLYIQRVDASGLKLWGESGLLVKEIRTDFNPYAPPHPLFTLISDSHGGAIVTWENRANYPGEDDVFHIDVYSQRINAEGELLWGGGILTGRTERIGGAGYQMIPDGTGGIIFAWDDFEPYYRSLHDDYLRLQRIAADGELSWGDEGVLVVASSPFREVTLEETAAGVKGNSTRARPTYEGKHYIVTDGGGGVIVLWEEDTGGEDDRVYAQRLDGGGSYVWTDRVTTAATDLISAESDGEGGVKIGTPLVTNTPAGAVQVYAHINGDGEVLPTSNWAPQYTSTIQVLGGSFRVRFEEDPPSVNPMQRRTIIYIQRLDETGQPMWPEKRIVNPPEKVQLRNINYLSDGDGGAIIVWQLQKDSLPYGNIMAQRLDSSGALRWGEVGMPVFAIPGIRYQSGVATLGDGSGGIIALAVLGRDGLSGDMVYAQRLDINGNRLWDGGVRLDR